MKSGRLGILLGVGAPDAEGEPSPKDMACKALWKSIKKDDYEGFKSALSDFLKYHDEASEEDDHEDED